MNVIAEALAWLFSPDRLTGDAAVPLAALQHLGLTAVSLAIASIIAIPTGWFVAHTGRGREAALAVAGAARALPSFGLILVLVLVFGVLHKPEAAVTAFVLLAIPSLLAGAITGVESVGHDVVDGGRACGMTERQILWKIEIPLGLPLLVGGIRQATLQLVATVTLAAYVNVGGLGRYIFEGLPLNRYDIILGGAVLVAAFALVLDGLLALVQWAAVPRGARELGDGDSVRERRRSAARVAARSDSRPAPDAVHTPPADPPRKDTP